MSEIFDKTGVGLKPGSRVGGYIIEDLIGQGGMAVVYKALDERLGRRVALKILAPAQAADDSFRQRFIRESRAAAAIDDPHIIPVFEAGEADGFLFIAMRYVQGGDVRSLLSRDRAMAPRRVASIVAPIAAALDSAHSGGLLHRDVKPANMLLDIQPGRPDHVYLSDFGLSKRVLESTKLTATGEFFGTVDYIAPEQIEGRQVDGRADQYSLGCAAFEMLCGIPPFHRDQAIAVLVAHQSEPPPRVTSLQAGLPTAVDPVFARVLAKSPKDRFRNCQEFSHALRMAFDLPSYQTEASTPHPDTVKSDLPNKGQQFADTISSSITEAERRITQMMSEAQRHHDEILAKARNSAAEIRAAAQEEAAQIVRAATMKSESGRQADSDDRGRLLIEVIVLRLHSFQLCRRLNQKETGALPVARALAEDIARVQRSAGQTALASQLAEPLHSAEDLVRHLEAVIRTRRTPYSRRGIGGDRLPYSARSGGDGLRDSLVNIPLDVSGVDVSEFELPSDEFFEALDGIVWTTETIWPERYRLKIENSSQSLRKDVYQIQI